MIGKVRRDLPALVAPDAATTEITDTLAWALGVLTRAGGRTADETEDRSTREPKSVPEVYKETYRTLMRFCKVGHPEEVAPVWGHLANCANKSEQHTILVQEFRRVCMARGLSTKLYTPIVMLALKQIIQGFQFVGHGVDDLSTGCQPFQVAYASSANHLQALATASIVNQLAQGEQSASLADYRTLRDKEKVKFPRDTVEVCITFGRYAVLCACQTLFQGMGPHIPIVEALWHLTAAIQNATPFITEHYQQVTRTPAVVALYFPSIVRAVQVAGAQVPTRGQAA
ncbi:hypothetical protein MHU86_7458 [Fragilaria crotonensis]|nr:hypothetical protein MHU86_7458 [Fragilaria crotonensis]